MNECCRVLLIVGVQENSLLIFAGLRGDLLQKTRFNMALPPKIVYSSTLKNKNRVSVARYRNEIELY